MTGALGVGLPTAGHHAAMRNVLTRARRYLRQQGGKSTLRRVRDKLLALLYIHEVHVWSALDLASERPRLALPPGYTLSRAGAVDLPELEDLGVNAAQARSRLASGAELWTIRHDGRVIYSGWVFHDRAPTIAARAGSISLSRGMVNPEDMITAPEHRGRGLASAAYALIFDDLQRDGRASRIVGKVPKDNAANRRALVKSGWREFAVVDFRRIGPWRRTSVTPVEADAGSAADADAAGWLADAMRSS